MSKTSYQREYRKNMTDEQKQRYREARIHIDKFAIKQLVNQKLKV